MLTARLRAASAVSALIIGAVTGTPPASASAPAAPPAAPIVHTDQGAARGASSDGVEGFLGLPYAAAPTGALRWKPPQPAAHWTGVRDATRFGSACAAAAVFGGPGSDAEDCLFINVWRPAGAHSGPGSAGARLPVHVFIHGGALISGSGAQYDESELVRETGVIGVSLNYRLGALGFLGLPALTAEGGESGNYGFLDQQAALRWVQREIGFFGGDPRRVTIDGESAGGGSVCAHLASPGSRGLFARAMIQSGACDSIPQAQAETAGTAFARRAGCTAAILSCLRSLPVSKILAAGSGSTTSLLAYSFVDGTKTLPVPITRAFQTGRFARVPVVIGANRDEGRAFSAYAVGAGKDSYLSFLKFYAGARADAVLARYPWPANADRFTAAYQIGAVITDSGAEGLLAGGCELPRLARDLQRYTATYVYEFDHRTGPGVAPIPGYVSGAEHAGELAYIWPSFYVGTPIAPQFNADERRLAHEMTEYWGAFTRYAEPAVAGQADWPRYVPGTASLLSLRAGGRSTVIDGGRYAAEHRCAFWDTGS